jgi:hypothetical protein
MVRGRAKRRFSGLNEQAGNPERQDGKQNKSLENIRNRCSRGRLAGKRPHAGSFDSGKGW